MQFLTYLKIKHFLIQYLIRSQNRFLSKILLKTPFFLPRNSPSTQKSSTNQQFPNELSQIKPHNDILNYQKSNIQNSVVQDRKIMKVNTLTSSTQSFTIFVRVLRVFPIRIYDEDKKMFCALLKDDTESEIRALAFDEVAEALYPKLQDNHVLLHHRRNHKCFQLSI